MANAVVLGGCGAVGRNTVKALAESKLFNEVVLADINREAGEALAAELGEEVTFRPFDASEGLSCRKAIDGADLVVNCVGPFYKTVKTILTAAIESGINYVDVCDDPDVTVEILEMNNAAQEAGITALIGMGASPGITNLLAKFISDHLLDETDSINIFHTHGGEPFEGPGVIGHRFHCMSIDIPMFLNGELTTVRYFEEDGMALRQTFDFPVIGKNIPLFPYPHPEQITLPAYIKVKNVTNKGSVLPIEYYVLTSELCRLGLTGREPLLVNGKEVVPYDFAVAFIQRERERILQETEFGHQRGAMAVVVKGKKDEKAVEYRYHTASGSTALGEGTGVPAAVGAMMLQQGKITAKGVLPPEACVDPVEFFDILKPLLLSREEKTDSKERTVFIEQIDEDGRVTILDP